VAIGAVFAALAIFFLYPEQVRARAEDQQYRRTLALGYAFTGHNIQACRLYKQLIDEGAADFTLDQTAALEATCAGGGQ
jgi:hypothetical protein